MRPPKDMACMDKARRKKSRKRHSQRFGIVAGSALIIFGVAFLLKQTGHLGGMSAWNFWPLILVVAGLAKVFRPVRSFEVVSGAGFVVAGVLVQLHYLGYLYLQWHMIWPVLLILFGVFMLGSTFFRSRRRRRKTASRKDAGDQSEIDAFVVFGGRQDRIDAQDFRGGEIYCVMGGYEVDLRNAEMEGDETTIHVTAIMAGVEIRIPETWTVTAKASPVMGAFEDKTRSAPGPSDDTAPPKKLILTGSAVMAGVEIRN